MRKTITRYSSPSTNRWNVIPKEVSHVVLGLLDWVTIFATSD